MNKPAALLAAIASLTASISLLTTSSIAIAQEETTLAVGQTFTVEARVADVYQGGRCEVFAGEEVTSCSQLAITKEDKHSTIGFHFESDRNPSFVFIVDQKSLVKKGNVDTYELIEIAKQSAGGEKTTAKSAGYCEFVRREGKAPEAFCSTVASGSDPIFSARY
jgi:hypothetical protein